MTLFQIYSGVWLWKNLKIGERLPKLLEQHTGWRIKKVEHIYFTWIFLNHGFIWGRVGLDLTKEFYFCTASWQWMGARKMMSEFHGRNRKLSSFSKLKQTLWIYTDKTMIEQVFTSNIYVSLFMCHSVVAAFCSFLTNRDQWPIFAHPVRTTYIGIKSFYV